MHVIATAGHIDHGKSTLVKALTGIDPDRLPEEKERGLTIDLGFAWFDLPGGETVGVVDVPGHERFIKNMVAGVGSINAVLFVVAADDGWMPQSTEHLQILSLLDIKSGLIILTKVDMVDKETVELQKQEIRSRTRGTFLEHSPIICFSAPDGKGRDEIVAEVGAMLERLPLAKNLDSPRLFIDRSFVAKGSGTVVTGTLIEGAIQTGQELELCPAGKRVRVRSLQNHKRVIERAVPVCRVAANISGAGREDAVRGSALVLPGRFRPTSVIAAKINTLPGLPTPLKNGAEVKFYLGTAGTIGRVKFFDCDRLDGDSEGIAVIRLDDEICCRIGDRFIIRQTSPPATIGGGMVLDWDYAGVKLSKTRQVEILKRRGRLDIESIVETDLVRFGSLDVKRLRLNSCFTEEELNKYLAGAENVVKSGTEIIDRSYLEKYADSVKELLNDFHRQQPWAAGIAPGDLSRKLRLPMEQLSKIIDHMISLGEIEQANGLLKIKGYSPHLKSDQKELARRLMEVLSANPLSSPLKKEFIAENPAYEIVINFLRDQGEIIELNGGVLFTRDDFTAVAARISSFLSHEGKATASQLKDHLGTTRKYMIPILEKLDMLEITRREGDYRVPGANL